MSIEVVDGLLITASAKIDVSAVAAKGALPFSASIGDDNKSTSPSSGVATQTGEICGLYGKLYGA